MHARSFSSIVLILTGLTGAAQQLSIRDWTGRGFPPDLISYRSDGPALLRNGAGDIVPTQTSVADDGQLIRFVTALPANETISFAVGPAGETTSRLHLSRAAGQLEIENELLGVRLPAETEQTFAESAKASTLPAPILGFRSGAGEWLGAGRILTDLAVKRFSVKIIDEGPVLVAVRYEIEWADGGFYRAELQVIDQVPLVKVTESYDLQQLDGSQFWELDLGAGWQPDQVETASNHGNGGGDPNGRVVSLADFAKAGSLQYLVGDQAWGRLSHLGCWRAADAEAAPGQWPLVGVVPLRKGTWRKSNALQVLAAAGGDLRVRLPMSARDAVWPWDITSETSPFSTQEHEPGLSQTFGRRTWGLALNHPAISGTPADRPCYQLRRLYGIIGLDRYKDFVLEWADTKTVYPRLPGTADKADSAAALKALRERCRYYFHAPEASHHGTSGNYSIAYLADAALAADLTPEERTELRARVALLTYLYEDADMMSYGNGHHHGNPNMGTARFWSGPCFLALIPDHPMFAAWRTHMLAYGAYNIANQIAPGGGYTEFGAAYHMHGYARSTHGLAGLAAAGADIDDLVKYYHAPDWQYYLDLLTPVDSRWLSRMVPGMANSPPGNTEHFVEAAGSLADRDPELAANLRWAWEANGANPRHSRLGNAGLALAPIKPALTSAFYPGVGVVFRAHQGPHETYMLFRCGFNWSHWYVDPGHFLLISRGATLVPFQPYQYTNSSDPSYDLYNTIRFGHPENQWPHSWGDSVMLDHAFGEWVDYAWASTGFPDWFISPGIAPSWRNTANVTSAAERRLSDGDQQQGPFTWDRQIMFLKGNAADSPNYFVVRDSCDHAPFGLEPGRLASYLNLNLLGTQKNIAANGRHIAVATEWPVKLDLFFTTAPTPAFHEQAMTLALHNANLDSRLGKDGPFSPNWTNQAGEPWQGRPRTNAIQERHVIMRLPAPPGQGYFWVVFPRAEDEPQPTVDELAPGVIKIQHREGTDYVFVSADELAFEGENVHFRGRAGTVRLTDTMVTLALADSNGEVGYKGHIVRSSHSFQQRLALSQLRDGTQDLKTAGDGLSMPAPAAEEEAVGPQLWRGEVNGKTRYRVVSDSPQHYRDGTIAIAARNALVETGPRSTRFLVTTDDYVELRAGTRAIRGFGPLDLTFTDDGIRGKVAGERRSLVVTWPSAVTRPMFHLDGRRFFAGWSDDHSIGKGTETPQLSLAFGVTDGDHTVEISEWTYPDLPPQPQRRSLTTK